MESVASLVVVALLVGAVLMTRKGLEKLAFWLDRPRGSIKRSWLDE